MTTGQGVPAEEQGVPARGQDVPAEEQGVPARGQDVLAGEGVLTMAYGPAQYLRMAKGLARSIRLHNPDMPLAIVTDRPPSSLRRWFDVVVPVEAAFGSGLAHKLHLDLYSPFERTLFIDADFLVFGDVRQIWEEFGEARGLGLFGRMMEPGEEHYAVADVAHYLTELGIPQLVMSNTGILYFDRSPTARRAFERARAIAAEGERLGVQRHPVGFYNDEPIFGAVVALLDLPFVSTNEHKDEQAAAAPAYTLGSFGTEGMANLDVRRGRSGYALAGHHLQPVAIHFNVQSQQSEVYDRELRRLEFGRRLGATPLPDAVTTLVWRGRRSGESLRRAVPRVRRLAKFADGWPYTSMARRGGVTPEQLVAAAAKRAPAPFTFVQVGSNDGRTYDPLFPTVMHTEARGLLIEPVPDLFERLKATYAGKPGLSFVQAAVAEEEGEREFHWLPPRPGDPEWSDQLGSFHRDVLLSHADVIPDIADRIETLSVPCRTLPSLVAEHGLDRIDVLHIDAEGHDLAILRSIDFAAPWAPRCILYEQKHLGADREVAFELLRAAGYSWTTLWADVFAFRRFTVRFRRVRGRGGGRSGNIASQDLL